MPTYETTMKDLLTSIKTMAKTDSDFSGIQTWKRGILPPMPTFPAFTVLPIRETFPRIYAGGRYHVERDVAIDVYVKGLESEVIAERVMDWAEEIKELVQADRRWKVPPGGKSQAGR